MTGPLPPVRIVASPGSWIVSEAVDQLERAAGLPGVVLAVGMPDLHPGRGIPIGAVLVTRGVLYPHLAGNDIGCGVGLWSTRMARSKKGQVDRWARRLSGLEGPWAGDVAAWLADRGVAASAFDRSLGTIGGGNHFAELQLVERIEDEAGAAAVGLDRDRLHLLVHSGSRGLGESILEGHVARRGLAAGLEVPGPEAADYRAAHDHAVAWAAANRALIAERFAAGLGTEVAPLVDSCHNGIEADGDLLVHRKGAAPADRGPVVIPGSRGAFSYLVQPLEAPLEAGGRSLAHGAGRKWSRGDARRRLEKRHGPESLVRTELGSRVVCEDRDLLYEEAPAAYKDVDAVIADLVAAGLAGVVAVLRPLLTYKVRR